MWFIDFNGKVSWWNIPISIAGSGIPPQKRRRISTPFSSEWALRDKSRSESILKSDLDSGTLIATS